MSHIVKDVRRSWVRALRRVVFSSTSVGVLGMPLVATISSDEAKLTVSAIVLKRASLQVLSQPASVVVTAADISRGYVESPSPLQVRVQSNSQGGYMLIFDSQGDFMRQILVRGLDNDVQLDAAGGSIAQRASGRGMYKASLALSFRFVLAESARQGLYAWPMRLSVVPL